MRLFPLVCFVAGGIFELILLLIELVNIEMESFIYAIILYGIAKVIYMEILKYKKKKVSYKGLIELLQSFCLGMFIPNIAALLSLSFQMFLESRNEQSFVLFLAGVLFISFMLKNQNEVNFKGS